MKNPRVFISYSNQDARWVRQFSAALRKADVEVRIDTDIPSGTPWESWLRDAISDSDAVVAVLSPESRQSSWSLFEVGAAYASGKPIIPVVSAERPAHLPLVRTEHSVERRSPTDTARRLVEGLAARELARGLSMNESTT